MSGTTWTVLNTKATQVSSRILNGFYVPRTWDKNDGDEGIAISGMLTQFLFTPTETTIHIMTDALLDNDDSHTEYRVFFDDGSNILLEIKEFSMNDYPGYLISIPAVIMYST